MDNTKELLFSWTYPQNLQERHLITDFFIDHTDEDYISHSEILTRRAENSSTWSQHLRDQLLNELSAYSHDSPQKAAIVKDPSSNKIVGLSLVEISPRAKIPHAWIHDFIVETDLRQKKIGSQFLHWLEKEFAAQDVKLIILESGSRNKIAHSFFQKKGFNICSMVMTK